LATFPGRSPSAAAAQALPAAAQVSPAAAQILPAAMPHVLAQGLPLD